MIDDDARFDWNRIITSLIKEPKFKQPYVEEH